MKVFKIFTVFMVIPLLSFSQAENGVTPVGSSGPLQNEFYSMGVNLYKDTVNFDTILLSSIDFETLDNNTLSISHFSDSVVFSGSQIKIYSDTINNQFDLSISFNWHGLNRVFFKIENGDFEIENAFPDYNLADFIVNNTSAEVWQSDANATFQNYPAQTLNSIAGSPNGNYWTDKTNIINVFYRIQTQSEVDIRLDEVTLFPNKIFAVDKQTDGANFRYVIVNINDYTDIRIETQLPIELVKCENCF